MSPLITQAISYEDKPSEEQWDKIATRDPYADGEFVFGVKTTGIYCRPSCPARRPKRENVSVFDLNQQAEASGFRACKRCRPKNISTAQSHRLAIEVACRSLELADQEPSLEALAEEANMSKFHFQKTFKLLTGVTPKQYRKATLEKSIRAVLGTAATITEAVFESGYNAASRYYDDTTKMLGMSPSSYRAGAKGEIIVYAFADSWLGTVSVAFSRRGICAVRLNDNAERGEAELRALFPNAILVFGEGDVESFVRSVVEKIEEPENVDELPLDIRGTAFQHRVWSALQKIPVGSTASYNEVAEFIGASQSSRAVAQACGANPVAVLVPCHRVVRTDGSLSGYRWGVERKTLLLKREAAA